MGVQDILNEIKEITTKENCKCLYRGEPKNYPKVSSKLYRDLQENDIDSPNVFITQKYELMYAQDQMQEPHFGPLVLAPFFMLLTDMRSSSLPSSNILVGAPYSSILP